MCLCFRPAIPDQLLNKDIVKIGLNRTIFIKFHYFIYQIKQKDRLEGKNEHDLGENTQIQKKVDAKFVLKKSLLKLMSVSTPDQF